jgi:hypothetical protein
MSAITDALSAFGLTGDIAIASALALADPTSDNINSVVKAYAANGQVPPTKLLAYLIQLNGERHPEDPYSGSVFPWVFAGAALLAFLFITKKGRG